jgi:hypothetical protein
VFSGGVLGVEVGFVGLDLGEFIVFSGVLIIEMRLLFGRDVFIIGMQLVFVGDVFFVNGVSCGGDQLLTMGEDLLVIAVGVINELLLLCFFVLVLFHHFLHLLVLLSQQTIILNYCLILIFPLMFFIPLISVQYFVLLPLIEFNLGDLFS